MKNFNLSTKKKNIFICIVIYLFYLYMAFCIPYMDDDWLNGSSDGFNIAMSGITNGRYFGNLIINILVRSKVLKTLVMSYIIWFIPYKISRIETDFGSDSFMVKYIIINILLMVINTLIWNEVFGWVTGFSVYTVSVVFLLFYIDFNKDIICKSDNNDDCLNIFQYLFLLLFSIVIQLFLENISIGIMIITTLVLVYSIKLKKNILKYLVIFIGNSIGTIIIFSSTMIKDIVSSGHSVDERALAYSIEDSKISIIMHMINRFFSKVWFDVWNYCSVITIITIVLLLFCIYKNSKGNKYIIFFYSYSIMLVFVLIARLLFYVLVNNGIINDDFVFAIFIIVLFLLSCYAWIKICLYKGLVKYDYIKIMFISIIFVFGIIISFSKFINGISFFIYTVFVVLFFIKYIDLNSGKLVLFVLLLSFLCNAPLSAVVDDSPRLVIHGTVLLLYCISIMLNHCELILVVKYKIVLLCLLLSVFIYIYIPLTSEYITSRKIEYQIEQTKENGTKELHIPDYPNKTRLYMKRIDGKIVYNFYDYYGIDFNVALFVDDELIYDGDETKLNKSRY